MRSTRLVVVSLAATVIAYTFALGDRGFGTNDVSRYAQMAFEMRERDTIVPTLEGAPYRDAMPLSAWLPLAVARVQGRVTPLSARVGPALASIGTAVLLLLWLRRTRGDVVAVLASSAYGLNRLSLQLGRGSRVDPTLALSVAATLAATFGALESRGRRRVGLLLLGGVVLSLGVAAKGPIAAGLVCAAVGPWLLLERRIGDLLRVGLIVVPVACGVTAVWLVPYLLHLGPEESARFRDQFLLKENVEMFESGYMGKADAWWAYGVHLVPAFAPWLVPALVGLARVLTAHRSASPLERLAASWAVAPLVVFSIASGKSPRYLLPLLPAFAILAGLEIERWLAGCSRTRGLAVAATGAASLALLAAVGGAGALAWFGGGGAAAFVVLGLSVVASARALVAAQQGRLARAGESLLPVVAGLVAIGLGTLPALPALELRRPLPCLVDSLKPLVPGDVPLTVVDTRPAHVRGTIDQNELALHLGRPVRRAVPGEPCAGLVLAHVDSASVAGSRLLELEWRADDKHAPERWVLVQGLR